MKSNTLIISTAFWIFISCISAFAQVRPGTISVTPYAGGLIFDKEQRLNSAPAYGLRLGYDFTPYFGIEASGNYVSTRYDRPLAVDQGSHAGNYRLSAILHLLPQYRLVPFLSAGYGAQSLDYPKGVPNTTAGAADYGGGLKLFLTDWLALRADVRHIYVFDHAQKNVEFSLGLSFLFGGMKAAPKPPAADLFSAPTHLSARPLSGSQINVSWKDIPGVASYRIYRDGSYLTSAASPALSDAGLTAGTPYCYRVTAVNKDGKESEQSAQACAATPAPAMSLLSPPADIMASAVSEVQNNVVWKEVAGARSYKIFRDGPYLTVSRTPFLSDAGLKAKTRYCYTVSAVDVAGKESERSRQACATTLASRDEHKRAAETIQKELSEKRRATIDIEFDYDKAVVKTAYHEEIKTFAEVMKAHPDLRVAIEGHTDNIGSQGYNLKLSMKRAKSVRDYMIKQFGVKASRLTAKGYGMSRPLAGNDTAEGRAKNRRVEAVVADTIKK